MMVACTPVLSVALLMASRMSPSVLLRRVDLDVEAVPPRLIVSVPVPTTVLAAPEIGARGELLRLGERHHFDVVAAGPAVPESGGGVGYLRRSPWSRSGREAR